MLSCKIISRKIYGIIENIICPFGRCLEIKEIEFRGIWIRVYTCSIFSCPCCFFEKVLYICLKEVNVFTMAENSGKGLVLTRGVYKEIFMEYYRPLCLFARRTLLCEEDAEDVVHNVFLAIWERKMGFADKQHLKAYLYQSVYNQSLTCIRRRHFTTRLQEGEGEDKTDNTNYLQQRIETEIFLEIMNAVEQLPEHRREIFKLSYMDGLKISEVAEQLQIAEETVRSQRMKARKQLQVILKDLFPLCCVLFFSEIC